MFFQPAVGFTKTLVCVLPGRLPTTTVSPLTETGPKDPELAVSLAIWTHGPGPAPLDFADIVFRATGWLDTKR
jgi:hypothetical protein